MPRMRLVLIALLLLSAAAAATGQAKQMSVNVKETQVREAPSYLGKVLGKLAYGDQVQVLESKKDWARIKAPAKKIEGWINMSALTAKKVVLSSGTATADQNASSGEVALAGKGFNSQIEAENRQDATFDYATVDRMSLSVVQAEQVSAFLEQGKLAQGGSK
jgi:SH3-like domain-containing protein